MKMFVFINTIIFYSILACSSEGTDFALEGLDTLSTEKTDVPDSLYPSTNTTIANHSEWTRVHYPKRIQEFKEDPLEKGDIVMIGNSLTEQGGSWADRLDDPSIRNRGIAGDTSDGVLERLGEIIWCQPEKVFLLIGTNDLWTANSAKKTTSNISQIVGMILQGSPDTEVFVQTVFPVQNQPNINSKVTAINDLLKSNEEISKYTLIDTYGILVNDSGDLTAEYTHDGVHLTEVGYRVWVDLLKNYLE